MGPQCEDGYTKLANELLEALCHTRIPGEPMQIFLTILRKTYGFGKKSDRIALSQFVEATGINKPNVARAIKVLSEMNMVVIQKDNAMSISYGINKHNTTWKPLSKKITVIKEDNERYQKRQQTVVKKDTHKRKKETITKEKGMLEICLAWKAYVEMRIKIKKPMTPFAMQLRVKDLYNLWQKGQDPVAVLHQSVASSWQDLYEVKNKPVQSTSPQKEESAEERYRKMGLIQ